MNQPPSSEKNHQRPPLGLVAAMGWSLVAHVVVLGSGFLLLTAFSHHRPRPPTVIEARLVRLGTKRPDNYLPRLDAPSSAGQVQNTGTAPTPTSTDKAPAPSSSAPMTGKVTGSSSQQTPSLSDVLSKLKKDEPVEGDESGSVYGTSTDMATLLASQRYVGEIVACMKANYALEGITQGQAVGRSATVAVWVAASGKFSRYAMETSSGLAAFDRSVLASVGRCGQVGAPPPEIREQVGKDGISVEFRP